MFSNLNYEDTRTRLACTKVRPPAIHCAVRLKKNFRLLYTDLYHKCIFVINRVCMLLISWNAIYTKTKKNRSWIGSINLFLVIVSGVYTGVLYDRGYLWAPLAYRRPVHNSDSSCSLNSYHLLYGGSFLMSFSLFMLSLAKPDHLWQVSIA